MKALVTGFSPFGGDAINPSSAAVRHLADYVAGCSGNLEVVTAELPTSFARAPRRLRALIAREKPDIVLCVGLAADRAAICIERVAINLCDARIADNDGAQLRKPSIDISRSNNTCRRIPARPPADRLAAGHKAPAAHGIQRGLVE